MEPAGSSATRIRGVGVDVVRVARVEAALARRGEAFARTILAPDELEEMRGAGFPAQLLAKRLAAKEAAAKALGLGFADNLRPADLRVEHDDAGAPRLSLDGRAQERAVELAVSAAHLSISDEAELAVAFVVLEGS